MSKFLKMFWYDVDDNNQQEQVKHIRQLRLDKLRIYSDVRVKNIKNSEVLSGEIVANPRY